MNNDSLHKKWSQQTWGQFHFVNSNIKFINSNSVFTYHFLPWVDTPRTFWSSWKKYLWIKKLNGNLISRFNLIVGIFNSNSKFINSNSINSKSGIELTRCQGHSTETALVLEICQLIKVNQYPPFYDIKLHLYPDDTQLYMSLDPEVLHFYSSLTNLEHCIGDIRLWMTQNIPKIKRSQKNYYLFGFTTLC